MFENYPKTRVELPEQYKKIYLNHYIKNREGLTTVTGIVHKMERWLHKKVAADVLNINSLRTLEIGAGSLTHLPYETTLNYDIVEPFQELFTDSPFLNRIQNIYQDINNIEMDKIYDRIISIATFEHIADLPKVVAKSCLLLHDKGTLRTAIPNEGTILWTLGWKLITGIEYRLKYGLDYGLLMRYEHINTAKEIEEVLDYFFAKNKCSCFGISKKFAFYRFYESREPRKEQARNYLESLK